MIEVTKYISIPENELSFDFVRASGPGGQNINKVATAVQLRFDVAHTSSLPDAVRERLRHLAGKRLTSEGVLVIEAKRYRSQEKNRQDALDRLVKLVRKAVEKPKKRRKTIISQIQKEQRLRQKQQRSQLKNLRKPVRNVEE
jgi:ribosome-associated protein